jgi:hypothetical protein
MRQIIFIIFALCCAAHVSYSQITITASDMQGWCDLQSNIYNLYFLQASPFGFLGASPDTVSAVVGTAGGAAETFSVASLPIGQSYLFGSYWRSAPDDSFPSATCETMTIEGNTHNYQYDFYDVTDTGKYYLGWYSYVGGPPPISISRYTPPPRSYKLPLSVGTQWVIAYKTDPNQGFFYYDSIYCICDAYGTIALPDTLCYSDIRAGTQVSGKSYSCLRIKRREVLQTDSNGVKLTNVYYTYEYLTKDGMEVYVSINAADTNLSTVRTNSVWMIIPDFSLTAVNEQSPASLNAIAYNYPNPFSSSTTITFSLSVSNAATLKIYDALGREVADLSHQIAGTHGNIVFDGSQLPAGMYHYRLTAGTLSKAGEMAVVK